MADYYPTLARAVSQLNTNSAEARLELFERARTILRAHLQDGPESDLRRERTALESAIRRVETEATFSGAFPLVPNASVTARTYGLDRESNPTSLRLQQHADAVALTIAPPPTSIPTNRGGIPDPRRVVGPDIASIPFEDFEEADTADNVYRTPSGHLRRDLELGTGAYGDLELDIRGENGPGIYGQTLPYSKVVKRKKLLTTHPRRPPSGSPGLVIMVVLLVLAFIGTALILSIANLPRLIWELEHAPDHPKLLSILVIVGTLVGILFFAIACWVPRYVLATFEALGSVPLGVPWGKLRRTADEFSDRL